MRGTFLVSLLVGLLLPLGTARADEQSDAREVVDKALKAMGGEAKLAKVPAVTFKAKGSVSEGGMDLTLVGDTAWQGMHECRLDIEAQVMGQVQKALVVINGDKGWAAVMGKVEDAPKEVMGILHGEIYALRLAQSPTLLKDTSITLSPLGEVKIGDRTSLGIKSKRKDHPEVDFYFDKTSGLLIKFELRVQEPGGMEVNHEFLLDDYKEADGLKHFNKFTLQRDGKKTMEVEMTEFKREEKLDDSLFSKPG